MSLSPGTSAGTVVGLWRYPIKSMKGEQVAAAAIGERGLLGDRAHALIDAETGLIVSAKNPRKWPRMFAFQAAYITEPKSGESLPPVRIACPDGSKLRSDQPDVDRRLSAALGRDVHLATMPPSEPQLENLTPADEHSGQHEAVASIPIPPGGFFDLATLHLLSTATLTELQAVAPASRFDLRRFRPNIVVETERQESGFVENGWVGRIVKLGTDALANVFFPCPRCVMTTLAQGDLPKDPGVLRAAARHNGGNVGVYATVIQNGQIARGETIRLE